MTREGVFRTKSGVFVRFDRGIGLLTYSPYTGLVFACSRRDSDHVLSWLEGNKRHAPTDEHLKALGPGWAMEFSEAEYPGRHLLPSSESQWQMVIADRPILINWLITGRCSLACPYCYARDLMGNGNAEPDEQRIRRTADRILSLSNLWSLWSLVAIR